MNEFVFIKSSIYYPKEKKRPMSFMEEKEETCW